MVRPKMKSYIALIQLDLKLALRQKSVLFFNYMFPLIFFVVFAQAMHGDRGNGMTQIVTMVIIIGVLGNGLFGAGMRAVQERESNVLRRYKVTPITPAPMSHPAPLEPGHLSVSSLVLLKITENSSFDDARRKRSKSIQGKPLHPAGR